MKECEEIKQLKLRYAGNSFSVNRFLPDLPNYQHIQSTLESYKSKYPRAFQDSLDKSEYQSKI